MSGGRGSAVHGGAAAQVMLLLVLLMGLVAEAAVYKVGERSGWTFNMDSWPKGKRFLAGDTLVFNYNPSIHNVIAVDKVGYQKCSIPKGAKTYRSGRDAVKLVKGQNFFICGVAGHCQSGMKIAIFAT